MTLSGKSCLVTGGAGFIGSHLVDHLMSRGCKVRVMDNLVNGTRENIASHMHHDNFEFLEGSVIDPRDVDQALKGMRVVFNLACLGVRHSLRYPYENHRVNAEGTLLLLAASRRLGVQRYIQCSSSEVYGTADYVPMPETHPTHPSTVYGASKLAGEAYARSFCTTYGLQTIVVRPFNTFGPRSHYEGDAGEVIPKSIVRALSGKPVLVFGDGNQTRDFTYVEDTARALVAAAECDQAVGQTLNIGCDLEISIEDLAKKIIDLVGQKDVKIEMTPSRPGDVLRLRADASRFKQLTLWKPVTSFDEGLKRTIDHFQNHPLGLQSLLQAEAGRTWENPEN